MTPEQFAELLRIATSVGGVVWEAALKQVSVNVILSLSWAVLTGALVINLGSLMVQLTSIRELHSREVEELPKSNSVIINFARAIQADGSGELARFLLLMVIVVLIIAFGASFDSFVQCVMNPEWVAIKLILSLGN